MYEVRASVAIFSPELVRVLAARLIARLTADGGTDGEPVVDARPRVTSVPANRVRLG